MIDYAWVEFRLADGDAGTKDASAARALINAPGISVNSDSSSYWEIVDRPQNTSLVVPKGYAPVSLTIPVLFDKTDTMASVEADVAKLVKLSGRGPGVPTTQTPPDIALLTHKNFRTLIPDYGITRWVIAGIDWDADSAWRRNDGGDGIGGHRVRQSGTVTVVEHVSARFDKADLTRRTSAAKRKNATHVVKKGETLMSIARKEYGDASRWRDIARANDIHDPRSLKVNTKLKIPK